MTDMREQIAKIIAATAYHGGEPWAFEDSANAIIAALPEWQGWQPIESAPRDGTAVIGAWEEGISIVEWRSHRAHKNCWAWMAKPWPDCDFLLAVNPTHWMPIPAPPTSG